jgi:hypothetical protein
MKKNGKKLTLSTQTIRALTAAELRVAHGAHCGPTTNPTLTWAR